MKNLLTRGIIALILMWCIPIAAEAAELPQNEELPFIIENGAIYYESSYGGGSGRYGTVSSENQYTTVPCYAGINAYSYLDANGNIICSEYDETTSNIEIPDAPENAANLMVHFFTTSYRNGWVNNNYVSTPSNNAEEENTDIIVETPPKSPDEVVDEIKKEIHNEPKAKTTIIIDYSGSMDDNQMSVIKLLQTINLDNTNIIVFANDFAQISHEDLKNGDFYVGTETFLYPALNHAVEIESQKVILISDLYTYSTPALTTSDVVESVIIYDPDDARYFDSDVLEDIQHAWKKSTITYVPMN